MSACAWCGGQLREGWVDTTALGSFAITSTRALDECLTPGCEPRCPTCHGAVGDIHGPHCGPIMMAKIDKSDPAFITRDDCGTRRGD